LYAPDGPVSFDGVGPYKTKLINVFITKSDGGITEEQCYDILLQY